MAQIPYKRLEDYKIRGGTGEYRGVMGEPIDRRPTYDMTPKLTANGIQVGPTNFGFGTEKAQKILKLMRATGQLPSAEEAPLSRSELEKYYSAKERKYLEDRQAKHEKVMAEIENRQAAATKQARDDVKTASETLSKLMETYKEYPELAAQDPAIQDARAALKNALARQIAGGMKGNMPISGTIGPGASKGVGPVKAEGQAPRKFTWSPTQGLMTGPGKGQGGEAKVQALPGGPQTQKHARLGDVKVLGYTVKDGVPAALIEKDGKQSYVRRDQLQPSKGGGLFKGLDAISRMILGGKKPTESGPDFTP